MTAGLTLQRARLAARDASGLRRTRRTLESAQGTHVIVDGREYLAFASNDYLGLANEPSVVEALREGARRFGAGAGASHLVCGHQSPHALLEDALAAFVRPAPDARCVTLSSGYLANLAILTALADRDSEILADRLNHACLNDGAQLARARLIRYAHADVAALRARLVASRANTRLIVTDAVFSMDGDIAPLAALFELAEEFDTWLVVDDAHGFGVLGDGRGSLADAAIASERIVYMGTLGKAAGVSGAFVCAHPVVIDSIVQIARPYIYTTAAPAALAAALLQSLDLIRNGARLRAALAENIARFRRAMRDLPFTLLPSRTAIQPLIVGDAVAATALAQRLWDRGLWVPAIRPPTVPQGTARLRISLSAAHTVDDIDRLTGALRQ